MEVGLGSLPESQGAANLMRRPRLKMIQEQWAELAVGSPEGPISHRYEAVGAV